MPTDPEFEAIAEKLNATVEAEPVPPLPEPVVKGRRGIPAEALEKLEALKTGVPAPTPSSPTNPFGRNVEVVESKDEAKKG